MHSVASWAALLRSEPSAAGRGGRHGCGWAGGSVCGVLDKASGAAQHGSACAAAHPSRPSIQPVRSR
jgi:hypothetical protein